MEHINTENSNTNLNNNTNEKIEFNKETNINKENKFLYSHKSKESKTEIEKEKEKEKEKNFNNYIKDNMDSYININSNFDIEKILKEKFFQSQNYNINEKSFNENANENRVETEPNDFQGSFRDNNEMKINELFDNHSKIIKRR
jgi:hypothetical protein